jgi:hypothetical protein
MINKIEANDVSWNNVKATNLSFSLTPSVYKSEKELDQRRAFFD